MILHEHQHIIDLEKYILVCNIGQKSIAKKYIAFGVQIKTKKLNKC